MSDVSVLQIEKQPTLQLEEPEAGCDTAGHVHKVDVTREEGAVGAAEGEGTSGLEVLRIGVIVEAREPEGHLR